MCLIINRPANAELDFEKFKIAMDNNPDGWGMSASLGDGVLKTFRSPEKADPEKLYKFVQEEFKEIPVLLHLRYTTVGETNLRNAHPFPILEKSVDGVDLRMAHNGTLFSYKGKKDGSSDTRNFVRSFVRPLFKRLIRGIPTDELLSDKWIETLLDNELTSASVLSFIDGYGNTLDVNAKGNGGFYSEDNVFFSNKYSFDPEHRLPKKTYGGYITKTNTGQTTSTKSNVVTYRPKESHAMDAKTKKFSEVYELIDPEDLINMSDELIDELVDKHPGDAKLLIKELLYEYHVALNADEGEVE